jgi:hypothetical protein
MCGRGDHPPYDDDRPEPRCISCGGELRGTDADYCKTCWPEGLPFPMFRALDSVERESFAQWARDHWTPATTPNPLWHPVVRNEWTRLDRDALRETGQKETPR